MKNWSSEAVSLKNMSSKIEASQNYKQLIEYIF